MRKSKYGAVKTVCRKGHKHDSQKEARRCDELYLLLAAGEISDLSVQPEFPILREVKLTKGKYINKSGESVLKLRGIKYIADFLYFDRKVKMWIVEDVKGKETKEYKLKRKLFLEKVISFRRRWRFMEV